MSKVPFFSVLIPTKNRSHIVGFAIQSVLEQSFGDFEIIVSDNDDSETLTRDVVAEFSDPRLKYYRTSGNLSMHDNWEFALSKSAGHYVTVLEDKQAFYSNALELICKCASGEDARVITWLDDYLSDVYNKSVFGKRYGENVVCKISSEEILQGFVENPNSWVKLPRLINSCVRRDVIDFVEQKTPLMRFFIEAAPDICAAFIQLNYVDYIVHIDSPLSVWGASSLSNAYRVRAKLKGHQRFFKELSKEDICYNHVPIKSKYILSNGIINEYLKLRELLGGRLRFTVSPRAYIIVCFRDIIGTFAMGVDATAELRLWKEYFYAQDMSIRKGLWTSFIKIIVKSYLNRYLMNLPRLINIIHRLRGHKTKPYFTGYNTVLDVVRDRKFLPKLVVKGELNAFYKRSCSNVQPI